MLLGVGEGDVGAEHDHAQSGGYALAATEAGVVFEFALQGCGEKDHEEIGGGVKNHGERAQDYELEKDVAAGGGDELRDEG